MSALLELAKSLGIDPGPLNQADLQEQACSRAIEGINTLKTEVKMLQNVTDGQQQYVYELAAQVERLRSAARDCIEFSCCDYDHSMYVCVRDSLESRLSETPARALAALKAKLQADILASTSIQIAAGKPEATPIQIATSMLEESKRIRQRAQEAGNANTDNQAP